MSNLTIKLKPFIFLANEQTSLKLLKDIVSSFSYFSWLKIVSSLFILGFGPRKNNKTNQMNNEIFESWSNEYIGIKIC